MPSRPNSSSDSPLLLSRIATSFAADDAEVAVQAVDRVEELAGVPVDVSVAAIFRAMRPDFPTPETMTRPLRPREQLDGAGELARRAGRATAAIAPRLEPRATRPARIRPAPGRQPSRSPPRSVT